MTTGAAILVLTAFLASAVEAVEALTVVLAVGVTRGWRSSLIGAGTATIALTAVSALAPSYFKPPNLEALVDWCSAIAREVPMARYTPHPLMVHPQARGGPRR